MPRKQDANLIPQAHKLTVEEASKGGKKSAEARKKKKLLRESLEELLEHEFKNKKGKVYDSGSDALAASLFASAMKGSTEAFKLIRDTVGQKPIDKIAIAEVDQSVIEEVEAMVKEDGEK